MNKFLLLAFLPSFLVCSFPWVLRNDYILFSWEDGRSELRVDPSGKGKYSNNILKGFLSNWFVLPPKKIEGKKDQLSLKGLIYCESSRIETRGEFAEMLDKTLGQSLKIPNAFIKSIEIRVPTWGSSASSCTLTLRKEGPWGEIIARKRCENVPDNSWQGFHFQAPLPPGRYYIEMSEPEGTIGWWSLRDRFPHGEAFTNDTPKGDVDRVIKIDALIKVGDTDLTFALRDNKFVAEARINNLVDRLYLPLDTLWKKSGYDISYKSGVLFRRFFTSLGQYYPVEQLKRREHSDPNLAPCEWIEATGTHNYDLRFIGENISLSWTMEEDTMHFHFSISPERKGKSSFARFEIEVKRHSNKLPGFFPRFSSSNPRLDYLLNRFYYERAFTYPPGSSVTWQEWNALIRNWTCSPLKEGERSSIEGTRMDPDGYVWTWGDLRGWPFPDPSRYDTRHFDTCAKLILASWRWFCWTGDEEFLKSQIGRLRLAMNYQLEELQGKNGIIITNSKDITGKDGSLGSNYWDILPFGHKDAYCNIYFFASLEAMKQIEGYLERKGIRGEREDLKRPPSFYEEMQRKAKEEYARNFWDEEKGRFIGCIDIDGVPHDYGFTFLNTEALFYGLGDEEKAKRIYHWMETEPTSSGLPDTYTKWIFAPRSNTIHNPMRREPQEPYPSWWFLGWNGTPYGDQCQDGGAILYTSFYDIMSRIKYLGADNGYKRLWEILERYSLPDKLCGGPPLWRGEIPQQENPGQVGTDLPFPESGLVPTVFLYGFMGIDAQIEGLKIRPNLPSELKFAKVENLCYRGLPLTITVTKDSVEIMCRKKGYEFHIKKELKPGETFVFNSLPGGKPFPSREGAKRDEKWKAQWIWKGGKENEPGECCFRKTFRLETFSEKAFIYITADNEYELYVNGKFVGRDKEWRNVERYNVGNFLRKGQNVIAVRCYNEDGPAGLLLQLEVNGEPLIFTDATWKVGDRANGWAKENFDDIGWEQAKTLGYPPTLPWGPMKK